MLFVEAMDLNECMQRIGSNPERNFLNKIFVFSITKINVLYLDLYGQGDKSWIFMQTKHLSVLIHIRTKDGIDTVKLYSVAIYIIKMKKTIAKSFT